MGSNTHSVYAIIAAQEPCTVFGVYVGSTAVLDRRIRTHLVNIRKASSAPDGDFPRVYQVLGCIPEESITFKVLAHSLSHWDARRLESKVIDALSPTYGELLLNARKGAFHSSAVPA